MLAIFFYSALFRLLRHRLLPRSSPLPHAPKRAAGRTRSAPRRSAIRFEDASDKAGIDFTHSFGSRQLGSLLEGTGAGCVWFDYNNSGLPDLFTLSTAARSTTRCIPIR